MLPDLVIPDALQPLARRLEQAQATQNDRLNRASGGTSTPLGGGFAHFRGEGHPLNQALGLVDAVTEYDLAAAEALLGRGGHPVVLELSPAADLTLWPLLAARGYRVHQLMLLWQRSLVGPLPEAGAVTIRRAMPEEEPLFSKLLGAAFCEVDDWHAFDSPFTTALDVPGITGWIALVDGEPAGGAVLGEVDGVALLSGDGVLPMYRGRGIQKALIAHRLQLAVAAGCDIACAGTAPMTHSQRAYESTGFRVAYPKLEMARG